MANPIKETPILYGNDALNVLKTIAKNKKISKKEYKKLEQSYNNLKKISNNLSF